MAEFVPLEIPPWVQWGQRRGAVVPLRPKGPNGRRLCGWCDTECPPRRWRWCSNRCANKYVRVCDWGHLSRYVSARDGWMCQRCGTTDPPRPRQSGWGARISPSDVDHIVPVAFGGTDDPANLRLLCLACHVAVGYEQRRAHAPQGDLLEEVGRA